MQKSSKKLHGAAKVPKVVKGAKFPKKKGKQKGKKSVRAGRMPKGKGKRPAEKKAAGGKRRLASTAKKPSRKPKDVAKARSAGRIMQRSTTLGTGSYPGAEKAFQHHAGKTLAASMGSNQQGTFSESFSKIAGGHLGSAFAATGVFQMMGVHAQNADAGA